MAKKCLTTAAKKGVFIQNSIHTDIFDLIPESSANFPFSYFRRSLPIQQHLIAQGAKYVVESHKLSIKVLHTGLKPTKINGIYSGDVFNPQTRSKSLILFCASPDKFSYTVYLFDGYFPKSLSIVINEILAL
jgi:hypothetical protein